ncbi:hypothetical protein CBOM_05413 [Ceraceosorus bombacis]|uniref:Cobalamin-independent methionine synthase MetE C-terminal/archaeal domain-containing protein n=1 Tax=Ceraceosorus bombacis TaxID=401625 RepID=A0A0P1BQT9_9BASI|nr:hypothetical protein CBOM_05413 [Ceraceosorus bombacis]
MSTSGRRTFRAEHVGSFLRPRAVHDARAAFAAQKLDAAGLRAAEDAAIREHISTCLSLGIRDLTDGEFRRQYFHIDFLKHLSGVSVQKNSLEQQEGHIPPTLAVVGKIKHERDIEVDNFEFLKSIVPRAQWNGIKVTIPSPTMLHFRGGRKAIDEQVYPDLDDFFQDLAAAYRAEIDALYKAGCRYLQLLAYLTDPKMRADAAARGEDLATLPHRYAELINKAIQSRPQDMLVGIHLCKGNFKSQFFAAGSSEGYAPIAEALFGKLQVDAYFLEWEDQRSGVDFSVLGARPAGENARPYLDASKTVVLGLVSSKVGKLEDKEELKRKLHDAAKFAPAGLEQLAISPQCGFSSTVHGNSITSDEQYAKLRLCKEVAEEVWGSA